MTDLGQLQAAAPHDDVVYPGHLHIAIPRAALDDGWLPVVGTLGLVVITQDKRIRYRPVERLMWVQHCVRGFMLTGRRSQSTIDSRAVLAHHWDEMDRVMEDLPIGAWMFGVTADATRQIEL